MDGKISAVILTKNEERNITECIKSLVWCDEIIVIDDNSTDTTVQIAKKIGINVFSKALDSNFSSQRNFGLEKAKGDWVIFIDADERVSAALREEIKYQISKVKDSISGGFYIKRKDVIWNKKFKHGEGGNIWLLRLAKKGTGKWVGIVHEVWKTEGEKGKLKNYLIHYPHQSIREFLEEINFYTSIRAEDLRGKEVKVSCLSILFYPVGKFFLNYFWKLGFLDGIEGLIFSILMSFHSFLVRGKLWLLWQKR